MGAFISGLLGGAADVMQKRRDAEAKKKDEFAKGLQGIMTNPDASPAAKQQAWDEWSKIYKGAGKESKSGLQQIGGLLQHVFGKPKQQGQPNGQGGPQDQPQGQGQPQEQGQGEPQGQGQPQPQGQPNAGARQVMPPPGQAPQQAQQAQQPPQNPQGVPQGGAAQVMPRPQQAQGGGLGQPGMFQNPNTQKLNLYEAEQQARAQIDQQITQQVEAQKDKAASDYAATLPPDQQKQFLQDYEDKKFLGTPRPRTGATGKEIPSVSGTDIAGLKDKDGNPIKDAYGNPIKPDKEYRQPDNTKQEFYPLAPSPKAPKAPTEAEKNDQLGEQAYKQAHNIPDRPLTAKERVAAKKEMKESLETDEQRDMRHLTMEMARANLADKARKAEEEKSEGQLDEETTQFWAEAILAGEAIPSLGYGKVAANMRRQLITRAAKIAKERGMTGTAMALQQLAYRAGGRAVSSAETQRTVVESYEANLEKNLDLLMTYSDQKDRTGSPLANKYQLYLQGKVAGDKDTQLLQNQAMLAANEFARIMVSVTGGGVTSDQARKEALEMINGAMSKGQIAAVAGPEGQMRKDMANRIGGYVKGVQAAEARAISGAQGNQGPGVSGGNVMPKPEATTTKTKTWNPKTRKFEDQ